MFTEDDQLTGADFVATTEVTTLRAAVVHRVIRFHPAHVINELQAHGVAEGFATEIASRIPAGFPIVVDDTDGMPIRSVLLHLLARQRRPSANPGSSRSLNSASAAAYDLCHFLDHLDAMALTFDDVIDQSVVNGFAEAQSLMPSSWTGRKLTAKTIFRRIHSVASFCSSKPFKDIGRADFSTRSVPAFGEGSEATIHPMTAEDWTALKEVLGPKPSERKYGSGSSVMRLVAEWSLWTAGRRTEVTTLPLQAVKAHEDLLVGPLGSAARRIRVVNTKGGRPRDLIVPAALLRETLIYVRDERAKATAKRDVEPHDSLFVRPTGWKRCGEPLTPEIVSYRFAVAVRSAAIARRTWGSAALRRSDRPYVFHDLRHTSAVWLYIAFVNAGLPEPWKLVQARLGHKRLETTTGTYLAYIDEFEEAVADLLSAEYDRWAA